jgi:hypothetical protein
MNETHNLKWEKLYWFLDKLSLEDKLSSTFDNDYIIHRNKKVPILMTSDGPIMPSQFDLWVAHTNFEIDFKKVVNILYSISGVEVVRPVSRYRFEVCIGKLFDGEVVRQEIKNKLCTQANRSWALVQDENTKKLVTITGDSPSEVIQKANNNKIVKKSWKT